MTTYGQIDASYFERNGYLWPSTHGAGPNDVALAIALAMPSVERSGARSQRGGLKQPGLGTYYHAASMQWGNGDVAHGLSDMAFFDATKGCTDKRPGNPSNKQNHLHGLQAAGLITVTRRNGQYYTGLTDAGVAQVTSVNRELGKLAKGYTVKALNKAFDAAAKADKAKAKPRKAKAKAQPVEIGPDNNGGYDDGAPVITPEQVPDSPAVE